MLFHDWVFARDRGGIIKLTDLLAIGKLGREEEGLYQFAFARLQELLPRLWRRSRSFLLRNILRLVGYFSLYVNDD